MSWSMVNEYEADVAPQDVYRYYADPSTWGSWAHNTKWGKARDAFGPGARVDVRVASYPYTYSVLIRDVEEGRRIVCEVRPFGVTIVSTYDVQPIEGGARLRHTIELSGRFERAYRLVEGQYTRMLHEETRKVAELARQSARPEAE
jgi:uncharacterized protein YndB with AHSA1/START domain